MQPTARDAVKRVLTTAGITGAALTLAATAAFPAFANGGDDHGDGGQQQSSQAANGNGGQSDYHGQGQDNGKSGDDHGKSGDDHGKEDCRRQAVQSVDEVRRSDG